MALRSLDYITAISLMPQLNWARSAFTHYFNLERKTSLAPNKSGVRGLRGIRDCKSNVDFFSAHAGEASRRRGSTSPQVVGDGLTSLLVHTSRTTQIAVDASGNANAPQSSSRTPRPCRRGLDRAPCVTRAGAPTKARSSPRLPVREPHRDAPDFSQCRWVTQCEHRRGHLAASLIWNWNQP
jgi:hypothetical protein